VQDAAAGEFVSGIEKGRRNALRLLRPTSFSPGGHRVFFEELRRQIIARQRKPA
jgi:hypothetical protein